MNWKRLKVGWVTDIVTIDLLQACCAIANNNADQPQRTVSIKLYASHETLRSFLFGKGLHDNRVHFQTPSKAPSQANDLSTHFLPFN